MLVEHKIQVRELNLLLRYAVQTANLRPIEAIAIEGFWNDQPDRVAAERLDKTVSGIQVARRTGMEKIRRVLLSIGIRSTRDALGELTDCAPPEPPEDAAVFIPKKRGAMAPRARKAALEASEYVRRRADDVESSISWHSKQWDERKRRYK